MKLKRSKTRYLIIGIKRWLSTKRIQDHGLLRANVLCKLPLSIKEDIRRDCGIWQKILTDISGMKKKSNLTKI